MLVDQARISAELGRLQTGEIPDDDLDESSGDIKSLFFDRVMLKYALECTPSRADD